MGQDRLRRTTIMIDQRHTEITHEDQPATIQPWRPRAKTVSLQRGTDRGHAAADLIECQRVVGVVPPIRVGDVEFGTPARDRRSLGRSRRDQRNQLTPTGRRRRRTNPRRDDGGELRQRERAPDGGRSQFDDAGAEVARHGQDQVRLAQHRLGDLSRTALMRDAKTVEPDRHRRMDRFADERVGAGAGRVDSIPQFVAQQELGDRRSADVAHADAQHTKSVGLGFARHPMIMPYRSRPRSPPAPLANVREPRVTR